MVYVIHSDNKYRMDTYSLKSVMSVTSIIVPLRPLLCFVF